MASIRKGAPLFSYRDKLLSPGGAGFLVQHSEDDDITQGWKDYFHKMNEKDSQCDLDESDDEENLETRRIEGKPGKLKFTAEEYAAWCMPWMNSQIIKILGANFPTYVIRDRINRMWRPKYPLKLIPLSNGYFIVSFSNKEDRAYAFQEGPWMIEDHYRQGSDGGRTSTLKKRIFSVILRHGFDYRMFPLSFIMLSLCVGLDGHQKSVCPTKLSQPNMPVYEHGTETSNVGGDGENNVEKGVEQGSAKAKVGGEDNSSVAKGVGGRNQSAGGDGVGKDGLSTPENATKLAGRKNSVSGGVVADGNPFGKLKILRRDFRGHLNVIDAKEVIPGSPSVTVERINVEPSKDNQQDHGRSESRMSIKNSKNTLNKDKGAQKGEWVQWARNEK
ncbi:hypothetical protein K1719_043853 [Acacia pycnantha]|nr:hypothetical protein K1719_043853 [Acacia pycnantha]